MIDGKCIADNIRAERNRSGLSQDEVSIQLGITRYTYIKYEKNADNMTIKILSDLSSVLNCNIKDFFVPGKSTKRKNEQ